ncbi:unnamed protein product [Gemmata massiliana]|uniref:Uncharacterized protein n=1 Tax=Gemmata massiliana TaxID=1210884 RepID=A0A6P2DKI0_9BACT|nr:hypothetical protein [Gemmata massiliana]VTS02306.1 unnamed protein product [Gemmata massiliana]
MAFQFNCPTCETAMIGTADRVGRDVRCPNCQAIFPSPEPPLLETGEPLPIDDRHPEPEPPREPRRREPRDDYDRDYDDRRPYDREYDEEPRPRRRRRPPPPPPGRGPLFWIVIIFGVLFLGTCACCGGGFLLLPGEKWHKHQSPEGSFAVDVPVAVKKDMPIPGVKLEPGQQAEGGVLWKRGEVYLISYMSIPPVGRRAMNEQALLDEAVNEMRKDREIKRIVRDERVTVSGYPGREVEYLYEDGGTYVGRLVISNRYLYIVVAGGRFVRPGSANVRKFLDSFEVTGAKVQFGRP